MSTWTISAIEHERGGDYVSLPRMSVWLELDGTIAFYIRVNALSRLSDTVLAIGCGRGHAEDPVPIRRELRVFRGRCQRVVGIDADEDAKSNPTIDEFRDYGHAVASG